MVSQLLINAHFLTDVYLFINSISKSISGSSSNGYRNSQRISNLAVCNSLSLR